MKTKIRQSIHLIIVFALLLSQLCLAQPLNPPPNPPPPPLQNTIPNGISIGRPKIFDNRTLTLMLETLSENLSNLKAIDPTTLASALNLLQGFQSTEFSSSLSATTLPIPGVTREIDKKTGNATDSGVPLPDSRERKKTVTQSAITPAAPQLDSLPTFPGNFNPNFGENASDLLSDQVNLTYQIFNLRMILERSLSDRLLGGQNRRDPRRQAVLGFNVTLDPPRTANDAVAVVEIKLKADKITEDGLSLVSLMPQEKTYNAAALSSKSNAYSGAAVAKIIQVGYTQRRRGQTFYLYRDTDTVAYERMGEEENTIVFGWVFRPVLGRRSVSPGFKQLFAVVSLPASDKDNVDVVEKLNAEVKTYWKKYDKKTMTSFRPEDANRASRFQYGLSLNLTKPEIFSSRYTNTARYNNIEVKSTNDYQTDLAPNISNIWWEPVGSKSVLISAKGNNFFTGTKVVMGDKTYASAADGLILKSNQAFDLTTSIDALTSSGAVIGRYGSAVPMLAMPIEGGIEILGQLDPAFSGNRRLEVDLYGPHFSELSLKDLPKDQNGKRLAPIITFNGNIVPLPYDFVDATYPKTDPPDVTNQKTNHIVLQASMPDSFVSNGGGIVKIIWPFLPESWMASTRFYDPATAFQVVRLSDTNIVISRNDLFGFTKDTLLKPRKANSCWHLRAGNSVTDLATSLCTPIPSTNQSSSQKIQQDGSQAISDNAVAVTLSAGVPDRIVLIDPDGVTYLLNVPKASAPAASETKPITINQYDSVWIDAPVKDVVKDPSTEVTAEANELILRTRPSPPDKDGKPVKMIQVEITRQLSGNPGDVDITVLDKDKKMFGNARIHINPCTNCNTEGGKK